MSAGKTAVDWIVVNALWGAATLGLSVCFAVTLVRLRLERALNVRRAAVALGSPEMVAGVELPDPNDTRWKAVESQARRTDGTIEHIPALSIGAVSVLIFDENVYVGEGPPLGTGREREIARAYCQRVIAAYRQRKVDKSLGVST